MSASGARLISAMRRLASGDPSLAVPAPRVDPLAPDPGYSGPKWEYMNLLIRADQLVAGANKAGVNGWEAWGILEATQKDGVNYLGVAFKRQKSVILLSR